VVGKELLNSMRWTAHGMKQLPLQRSMAWVAKPVGGWLPALPGLSVLLQRESLDALFSIVSSFDRLQFDERYFLSFCSSLVASLFNAMLFETL
jgi:hypothetical protein